MKKMTADDLKNLKHGDRVYRWDGFNSRKLDFVGFMPRTERYLIFCDGEYLTHLYISPTDEKFYNEWYNGKYDPKFIGDLIINKLKAQIEDIKAIYLDE